MLGEYKLEIGEDGFVWYRVTADGNDRLNSVKTIAAALSLSLLATNPDWEVVVRRKGDDDTED